MSGRGSGGCGSGCGSLIALIFLVGIIGKTFGLGQPASTPPPTYTSPPRPTSTPTPEHITGKFLRWEAVDSSHGYAVFSITNHGTTDATAACTIQVSNDFGNFGFDFLDDVPIKAGETIRGRIAISVGDGSRLINSGEVTDC